MQRRYGVLILISVVVVLCAGYSGARRLSHLDGLPFFVQLHDAQTAVIEPIPGVPLPGDLHPGDQIDLQSTPLAGRLAIFRNMGGSALPVGQEYVVAVRRADSVADMSVTSVSRRALSGFMVLRLAGLFTDVFLAVVGLLALWRGRDRIAAGLALWMIANTVVGPLDYAPADGMTGFVLGLGDWALVLLARVGFYIMAESVAGAALSPRARLAWRTSFLALLIITAVQTIGGSIAFVTTGWAGLLLAEYGIALPGCYLLAVALLFISYRHAAPTQRPRLRWMLGSGAAYAVGILLADLSLSRPQLAVILGDVLLQVVGVAGFLYATLRHRVVDFKVVLNRALVYAGTTSFVLGLFALFESVVERMALGKEAGLVLELGVPLVLGASLSTVHRRIDGVIDRFVFRRQYREDLALREFGKECAFVTQPDRLLDLTVEEVGRYTEAPWVALYERGPAGYVRVRQSSEQALPATLGIDDLALVKLRTHGADLNLHGVNSSLGAEGYAFPLRMRDKLMGILVLGPRSGDSYSTEERELLAHVAHQVGAALFALRAEATESRAQASEASLRESRAREKLLLEALQGAEARSSP